MDNNENNKNIDLQGNQPNNSENVNKINQKHKKKKHTFLKIILIVVIIFLAYKGVRFIGNSIAEKKLNSFMEDYPFTFSNKDNYKAITEDFKAKNIYKLDNKEYKVTWTSNSDCIKFDGDNAKVNNLASKNKKVEVKANYSILFGIGKASKTFDVTVLTKNKIKQKDVNVVSVNSVKDKSYNRDMKMTLTSKGDVASMYGDFKQSIYTADDCYTVLKAYKSNLKINSACDFNLCDILYGNDTTTYIYYLTVNKYNIEDKKIYISVNNNDNYSIQSIKCNFDKDISKYPKAKPQSDINIYNLLSTTYNRTKENTIFTYKSYGYNTIDNNIYLIGDYVLIYDNDEIHEIYVDIINGKIIKEVDSSKNIMEKCTGIGVMGDKKEFEAFKSEANEIEIKPEYKYILYDNKREIYTFNTYGSYTLYNLAKKGKEYYKNNTNENDIFMQLAAIDATIIYNIAEKADYHVSTSLSNIVGSSTNEFNDDPVAVDAYYNIIKAYDYYYNHFGLKSYDNNGAAINLYVNNKMSKDNACWDGNLKSFIINPVENFEYSLAKDCEILGHEYTHSVFGGYSHGSGTELSGLNEAYADIFGVFIKGYTDWKIGKNEHDGITFYIRDLTEINSPDSMNIAIRRKPAPIRYHDATWDLHKGESHAISCMIGHIAYQMYSSGKFTNTELENIWYKSLTYGYNANDTYVTCRQQILQAMNDLDGSTFNGNKFSFSSEQRDLVRSFFDEAEIFDTTDTYECKSDTIEGDLIKDDTDSHRFAMMMSPIGFIFNKSPIYIYEECKTPSKEDMKIVQSKLNESWNSIEKSDLSEYVGAREGDAIIYKQVPTWQMNFYEWWIGKTTVDIDGFMEKTLNKAGISDDVDSNWLTTLKRWIFTGTIDKTTRYKFYESFLNN